MEYKTYFGTPNLFSVWINRLIWTGVLTMAVLHFDENPEGLTILIIIILFFLSKIKTDELIVNESLVIIRRKIFYDIIPIVSTIQRHDLAEIVIEGNRTMSNNIIFSLLPIGISFKNRITFVLSDGTIRSIRTDIFRDELESFRDQCISGRTESNS